MTPVAAPASASRSYRRGAICASANAAPAEHARQRRDLLDVRRGIAPDALGIAAVDLVDLLAGNVLAIRAGDAEMPRHGLEPVTRELARREVVPQHRVERVDQLAPGRDEPHRRRASRRSTCRAAAARWRSPELRSVRARAARRRRRARRSRNGRSNPCRLWFSITSGSIACIARDQPANQVALPLRRPCRWLSSISAVPSGRAPRSGRFDRTAGSSPVVSRSNCMRRSLIE